MQKKVSGRLSGTKRFIAGLLSLVMIVSYMPTIGAMAAELPEGSEIAAEDTVDVSTTGGDVDEVTTPGVEDTDVPADGASDEDAAVAADVQDGADDAVAADDAAAGDVVDEEQGDETEMLGGEATPKFFFALESASNIQADNMTLKYIFKDEDKNPIGTNDIIIHPNQTQNVYRGETADGIANATAIPDGAKYVVIMVQTAGNTLIYDTSDINNSCSIQVVNSSNAIEKDYELSESNLNAIMDAGEGGNGLELSLDDVIGKDLILKVYIKVVKGNNGSGGGEDPAPEVGQYRVMYDTGKFIPEGIKPAVNIRFDTQETAVPVDKNVPWTDMPIDSQENTPTEATVSIPETYQKYFQNGYIDIYNDKGYVGTMCDLFDEFRKVDLNDPNAKYPYSYTFEVHEGESYSIRVLFSYTRSLSWSYLDADKTRDNYVEHCKLFLLGSDGKEREYVDEAFNEGELGYASGNKAEGTGYANYQLEIGKSYQFKLVPDYGYQVAGLSINGHVIEPSEVEEEVGIFNFTMDDHNFHLNGVVRPVENSSEVYSTIVNDIDIQDADSSDGVDPLEKAVVDNEIGGTLDFVVSDASEIEDWATTTGIMDNAKAVASFDIEIENILDKGTESGEYNNKTSEDYWTKEITELSKPAKISLEYKGAYEEGVNYQVVREHNGTKTVVDAEYDDNNGILSFESDKFSTFTIVRSPNSRDSIIFDLSDIDGDDDAFACKFKALKGLSPVQGQAGKYTYIEDSSVEIGVQVKDGEEYRALNEAEIGSRSGDWWQISTLFFNIKTPEGYDWSRDVEDNSDGWSVISIPYDKDVNDSPIDQLLEAAEKQTVSPNTPVIKPDRIEVKHDDKPMRQVKIEYPDGYEAKDFELKITGLKDDLISNIELESGKYYIDDAADEVAFEFKSKKDGVRIDSVTYKVNDAVPNDEDGVDVVPARYPGGNVIGNDDLYKIDCPKGSEWDWQERLGLTLIPNVTAYTPVTIDFGKNSIDLFDNNGQGEFAVSASIGSLLYDLSYEPDSAEDNKKAVFKAEVPKDSIVTVSIESTDKLNTITGVEPTDASKNSGKLVKASKNGEYTLDARGKDSVSLLVNTAPVIALAVTTSEGMDIPAKTKYSMRHSDYIKAFVVSGAKVVEGVPTPTKVTSGVTFKNGSAAINTGITNCELDSTGEGLGLAGKKLSLKAEYSGKTYSTTVVFAAKPADITSVSIKEAKDKKLAVPYATIKYLSVIVNKGADPNAVALKEVNSDGSNPKDIGFGNCENGSIYISDGSVIENYMPGQKIYIAFFDGTTIKSDVYELTFTDELAGKNAPSVKANSKLTTNRELGLNLSLPKGVKATNRMYYKITARTDKGERHSENHDGRVYSWYDGISNLEDINGTLVVNEMYKETVTEYVPATTKSYALDISNRPQTPESGWPKDYEVTVSLVYYDQDANKTKGDGSLSSESVMMITKDMIYETKLGLIKKAPKKVYVGEKEVILAVPKYSANTTVKGIDRVDLFEANGNGVGSWNRWNEPGKILDRDGMNWYLNVDDTGAIYLNTYQDWQRPWEEEDHGRDYLKPGKYKIVAYSVSGPGVSATASMDFTVVNSIGGIDLTAPSYVYKQAGKKATFKVDIKYSGFCEDDFGAADTKKVKWVIATDVELDEDDNVVGITDLEYSGNTTLKGKVTVKNGTVSIDPKLLLSRNPEENSFYVCAWPDDYGYERTEAIGVSGKITISPDLQVPDRIAFRWDDGNVSDISDESIANGDKFYTNSIKWSYPKAYDKLGNDITDNVTFKLTGMALNENGEISMVKPGNVSITATSKDGNKKSKTLKFKIYYSDDDYQVNVLIKDSSRHIKWDGHFINATNEDNSLFGEGLCDPLENVRGFDNNCPANMPIYVYVAGVRAVDWDGNPIPDKEAWCYDDRCMIAHSIKVTGGKVVKTDTSGEDHYVIYTISPNAPQTVITVIDNTNADRKKEVHKYTVNNTDVSKEKAYKITPDKKSILSRMDVDVSDFELSGIDNPNTVTYTVANGATLKNATVRITMDEVGKGYWSIMRTLNLDNDYNEVFGNTYVLKDGKFTLDFFEKWGDPEINHYHLDSIPAGTYTFYATIGTGEGDKFVASAAPTKLTVKAVNPAKITTKWSNVKYAIASMGGTSLDVPTVTNALGVRNWSHKEKIDGVDHNVGDAYWTRSNSNKGVTNAFEQLFAVSTLDGSDLLKPNEKPVLIPRVDDTGHIEYGGLRIQIDKKHTAAIHTWYELNQLRLGEFRVDKDHADDWECPYCIENHDHKDDVIYVSAAAQKKAYTAWAKANLTGYIAYRVVDFNGRENEFNQQITVDITDLLESAEQPNND